MTIGTLYARHVAMHWTALFAFPSRLAAIAASLPRRSPRGVVGPSASSPRRWNYNSAGAGLVHAFDSRRAVCELLASHNTQILACFPRQLD